MPEYEPKVRALAEMLDISPEDITEGDHTSAFMADGAEYMVLTDAEADDAADEALESYLDECIFPDMDETARRYFDREAWKRDALISDGRGHTLSMYDGEEHEAQIDGAWYFAYRIN